MKSSIEVAPSVFQPITLTIHIETAQDLLILRRLHGAAGQVAEAVLIDPDCFGKAAFPTHSKLFTAFSAPLLVLWLLLKPEVSYDLLRKHHVPRREALDCW